MEREESIIINFYVFILLTMMETIMSTFTLSVKPLRVIKRRGSLMQFRATVADAEMLSVDPQGAHCCYSRSMPNKH